MHGHQTPIESWAKSLLLQAHVIAPCPKCGFLQIQFSNQALHYAHGLAEHHRFPGLSEAQSVEALDAVLNDLGDECPAC